MVSKNIMRLTGAPYWVLRVIPRPKKVTPDPSYVKFILYVGLCTTEP